MVGQDVGGWAKCNFVFLTPAAMHEKMWPTFKVEEVCKKLIKKSMHLLFGIAKNELDSRLTFGARFYWG